MEQGIADALGDLEEHVEAIKMAAEEAARAEALFKGRFARARMTFRAEAPGRVTTDQAEDHATAATEDERLRYLLGKERLTACREALGATRARLDALRTLSASVRAASS